MSLHTTIDSPYYDGRCFSPKSARWSIYLQPWDEIFRLAVFVRTSSLQSTVDYVLLLSASRFVGFVNLTACAVLNACTRHLHSSLILFLVFMRSCLGLAQMCAESDVLVFVIFKGVFQ